MVILFLIFFGSDLDQTWSNWIFTNKNVSIKSCHIYHEDKYGYFIFYFFGSDLSKMDQICPKWIRSVQNGSKLNTSDFSPKKICPKKISESLVQMNLTSLNWIFILNNNYFRRKPTCQCLGSAHAAGTFLVFYKTKTNHGTVYPPSCLSSNMKKRYWLKYLFSKCQ